MKTFSRAATPFLVGLLIGLPIAWTAGVHYQKLKQSEDQIAQPAKNIYEQSLLRLDRQTQSSFPNDPAKAKETVAKVIDLANKCGALDSLCLIVAADAASQLTGILEEQEFQDRAQYKNKGWI